MNCFVIIFESWIKICIIKEWVSFFCVHGEWIVARAQTNRVNRETVLGRFVWSALRFIPNEPREKTLIPYIYNASNNDSFSNSQPKVINSKFSQLQALSFIWCTNPCACDSAHCHIICWLFIGNWTGKKISRFQRRKYDTIVNIETWLRSEYHMHLDICCKCHIFHQCLCI